MEHRISPARDEEQGVTSASLRLHLAAAHSVRSGEDSAGEARRTHCVSMRVNETELAALLADAQARHTKLGALLRASYFDQARPVVPAVNGEKWQALGQTLADLRALALKLNAGQLPGELRPVLGELTEQLHGLRAELAGEEQTGGKDER
jgi:hypothetical protein